MLLACFSCALSAMEKKRPLEQPGHDQLDTFWSNLELSQILSDIPPIPEAALNNYQPQEKYQRLQQDDTPVTTNAVIQEQPDFSEQLTEMRIFVNALSTIVADNTASIEKLETLAGGLHTAIEEIKKSVSAQENNIKRLIAINTNNYKPVASPVPAPLPKLIAKNPASPILTKLPAQADKESQANNGYTPLMRAVVEQDVQRVKDLLNQQSVNVNSKDVRRSATALHYAIDSKQANLEIIDLLINNGANINACARDCETPLHLAILKKNSDIITLLLKERANPKIKMKYKGKELNALDIAQELAKNEPEIFKPIIELLIKHSAHQS